jgi:hypothetical protein
MRTLLVAALTVALVPTARADSDPPSPDVPDTTPVPAEAPADVTPVMPPALTPMVTPVQVAPAPPADRTNAYIATGITGALLVGAFVCLVKFEQASSDAGKTEPGMIGTEAQTKLQAAYDDADSWRTRGLVMGGAVLVGAVVSGYLWGETEPKRTSLGIHPTGNGAAVSLSGRF